MPVQSVHVEPVVESDPVEQVRIVFESQLFRFNRITNFLCPFPSLFLHIRQSTVRIAYIIIMGRILFKIIWRDSPVQQRMCTIKHILSLIFFKSLALSLQLKFGWKEI